MGSFEKIKKITKSLARLIKKGREDPISGMPSEDTITEHTDIMKILMSTVLTAQTNEQIHWWAHHTKQRQKW